MIFFYDWKPISKKKEQKKEMRSKTSEELTKELLDLRSEVARLAIDMKMGKVTNTNTLYRKRKDIARVLTYLGEKSNSIMESKPIVAKAVEGKEETASV